MLYIIAKVMFLDVSVPQLFNLIVMFAVGAVDRIYTAVLDV
jgi:hypothetical protein